MKRSMPYPKGSAPLLCAVFCAALMISAIAVYAGEPVKVNMAYCLKQGKSNRYKVQLSQEFEVKGYGYEFLIDMEYTEKCVGSVNDTLFNMEMTVDKISAEMKRNDELIDTDLDEQMLNQKFLFSINRNGMISDVQAKGYIENEGETMGIMEMLMSLSYPYLPARKVAIGEGWDFSGSTVNVAKSEMDIESKSEFKVEEIKKEKGRKCVKIKSKDVSLISGRMENESGRFVVDGEGKGKGEFFFDIENACVVKLKADFEAALTMIDASGEAAARRESYETNITYHVKKELK